MEIIGYIIGILFIIIMVVLLGSFLFIAYQSNRIKNKIEGFVEDKAKELITEENIVKAGSKFQRKMEEALKKREKSLHNKKK
jgi:hypothetical protein